METILLLVEDVLMRQLLDVRRYDERPRIILLNYNLSRVCVRFYGYVLCVHVLKHLSAQINNALIVENVVYLFRLPFWTGVLLRT